MSSHGVRDATAEIEHRRRHSVVGTTDESLVRGKRARDSLGLLLGVVGRTRADGSIENDRGSSAGSGMRRIRHASSRRSPDILVAQVPSVIDTRTPGECALLLILLLGCLSSRGARKRRSWGRLALGRAVLRRGVDRIMELCLNRGVADVGLSILAPAAHTGKRHSRTGRLSLVLRHIVRPICVLSSPSLMVLLPSMGIVVTTIATSALASLLISPRAGVAALAALTGTMGRRRAIALHCSVVLESHPLGGRAERIRVLEERDTARRLAVIRVLRRIGGLRKAVAVRLQDRSKAKALVVCHCLKVMMLV